MKKISLFLLCLPLIFMLNACEEVNTLIDLTPPSVGNVDQLILDSSFATTPVPAAQVKNVLIEDFTGDKCDNCPRAQGRGITIENQNPGRVSVVGIQCTSLDIPYVSTFDLRTPHGDDLLGLEGTPVGLPQGDVDRKIYAGNPNSLMTDGAWPGNVSTELGLPTIANINQVSKSYDPVSRTFSMMLNVTFTQGSTDTFYLSTALTESGMIGPQLTPTGENQTFQFEHVLRKMMSPWNGLQIASSPAGGKTCQVKFNTVVDPKWVADSCKVVTFVHRRGAKNDVEQVMETTVK